MCSSFINLHDTTCLHFHILKEHRKLSRETLKIGDDLAKYHQDGWSAGELDAWRRAEGTVSIQPEKEKAEVFP